jgi:hypothetical protein
MLTDAEIYLRILTDLHFMSEIIRININEADSFSGKMLRERYAIERETIRLEQERTEHEAIQRQLAIEQQTQHKDD